MKNYRITANIESKDYPSALRVADALKLVADEARIRNVNVKTLNTGETFFCPRCGASNWKACYYNAVSQGCTVVIGPDDEPVVTDYDGDEEFNEATANESLWCRNCDYEYPLGIFRLLPVNEQ